MSNFYFLFTTFHWEKWWRFAPSKCCDSVISNWWFDCMVSYIICFLETSPYLSTPPCLTFAFLTNSPNATPTRPFLNPETMKKYNYKLLNVFSYARVWIMPSKALQNLNLQNLKFWEDTFIVWAYPSTRALNISLTNLLHNLTRNYIC